MSQTIKKYACRRWAKYAELGGSTIWDCLEQPPANLTNQLPATSN